MDMDMDMERGGQWRGTDFMIGSAARAAHAGLAGLCARLERVHRQGTLRACLELSQKHLVLTCVIVVVIFVRPTLRTPLRAAHESALVPPPLGAPRAPPRPGRAARRRPRGAS